MGIKQQSYYTRVLHTYVLSSMGGKGQVTKDHEQNGLLALHPPQWLRRCGDVLITATSLFRCGGCLLFQQCLRHCSRCFFMAAALVQQLVAAGLAQAPGEHTDACIGEVAG